MWRELDIIRRLWMSPHTVDSTLKRILTRSATQESDMMARGLQIGGASAEFGR